MRVEVVKMVVVMVRVVSAVGLRVVGGRFVVIGVRILVMVVVVKVLMVMVVQVELILFLLLFSRWTLIGITSAGFGCAVDKQPGIYHKVGICSNCHNYNIM